MSKDYQIPPEIGGQLTTLFKIFKIRGEGHPLFNETLTQISKQQYSMRGNNNRHSAFRLIFQLGPKPDTGKGEVTKDDIEIFFIAVLSSEIGKNQLTDSLRQELTHEFTQRGLDRSLGFLNHGQTISRKHSLGSLGDLPDGSLTPFDVSSVFDDSYFNSGNLGHSSHQ